MEEKVLKKNKNGMAMLMLFIALYVAAIAAIVSGAMMTETAEASKPVIAIILIVVGVVYVGLGWIFFLGLKVLKPQEALVLTLFGKYVGTIKDAGFYYVNPFCTAVNPAAETKLNQSGDVAANNKKIDLSGMSGVTLSAGGNAQMAKNGSEVFNIGVSDWVPVLNKLEMDRENGMSYAMWYPPKSNINVVGGKDGGADVFLRSGEGAPLDAHGKENGVKSRYSRCFRREKRQHNGAERIHCWADPPHIPAE